MSKLLITSALPYINGIKHIGNLVGSMLPADVYARYMRQRGHEVLYICATDEHGTPAELAALEAGLEVAEYCRQQHKIQADIYRRFHLSFDYFGRSSSKQNIELTQHLYRKLDEHGLIEERTIKQVYSLEDARFLPDRYIVGTCPHCGYEMARGDQCENCTRLLDPTDLLNPRSAVSGSSDLEVRESRHLYLRQSALANRLKDWIDSQSEWPPLVTSIAGKWLQEGLHDRCITRDLSWGVPVDRPGYEGKVFYVWFDAPIAYIAATRQWSDQDPANRDWQDWWLGADDVRYVQFMAKDNIPFHTISFPGTLLGSGEPWTLPDMIKGFNWLTFYGGKFSTSQKRGIFMDQALELFPADYWRYYLMANAPETDDSDFKFPLFAGVINKDLADIFGNFINRCLKFCRSKFGETLPEGGTPGETENELADEIAIHAGTYAEYMEQLQFRKAVGVLRAIWSAGNAYFEHAEPWKTIKTDPEKAAMTVRVSVNLARLLAILSWPIIPELSSRVLEALHLDTKLPQWPMRPAIEELEVLKAGHAFDVPDVLVTKIPDEEIPALVERFGG